MKSTTTRYETTDTLGKSPAALVVKVYNGAIANLTKAYDDLENNRTGSVYDTLEKARKFIVHLHTTLDMEQGGDIALKLSQMYVFIINGINTVQATRDKELLKNMIDILNNIREAWNTLAEDNKKGKSPADAETECPARGLSISI